MIEILLLIKNILGYAVVSAGLFFVISGVVGIHRMPDFFSRLHPAGVVETIGSGLVCLGFVILAVPNFISLKILLLLIFILISGPATCHALANSGIEKGRRKK